MSALASQITGVSIVCSTVGPGADQRKHQSSASLVAQKASNAENVSGIWWRHHGDWNPMDPIHIKQIMRYTFPYHDVIMTWGVVRVFRDTKCNSRQQMQLINELAGADIVNEAIYSA